jgi:hypothetical protein
MPLEVWGYIVDSYLCCDREIDIGLVEATNAMSSGYILLRAGLERVRDEASSRVGESHIRSVLSSYI